MGLSVACLRSVVAGCPACRQAGCLDSVWTGCVSNVACACAYACSLRVSYGAHAGGRHAQAHATCKTRPKHFPLLSPCWPAHSRWHSISNGKQILGMCAVMMMIPMMTAIMMIVRTKQILTRTGTVMAISRCAFSLASKAAHGQGSLFQHTTAPSRRLRAHDAGQRRLPVTIQSGRSGRRTATGIAAHGPVPALRPQAGPNAARRAAARHAPASDTRRGRRPS